MRSSRSLASPRRWSSWPSSHAMRNWRPLMVTFTCDIGALSILCFEHVADVLHRGVEPSRHVAVGGLKAPHPAELRIEISGKLGAVGVERVHPLGQRRAGAVNLDAAIHRGVEHVQRLAQALGCLLDEGRIAHDSTFHRAAGTNEN